MLHCNALQIRPVFLQNEAQPTWTPQTRGKQSDKMATDHMADCHIKYWSVIGTSMTHILLDWWRLLAVHQGCPSRCWWVWDSLGQPYASPHCNASTGRPWRSRFCPQVPSVRLCRCHRGADSCPALPGCEDTQALL